MTDDERASDAEGVTTTSEVTIRRAPKVPVFLVLGSVIGVVVAFVATAILPVDPAVGFGALFGYLVLYTAPIGLVLGAVVAIVLDRVSVRRARRVTAELTTVDALPFEGELES